MIYEHARYHDDCPSQTISPNILNMTADPVNLPMFMIVVYESSVSVCIVHAKDDEPYMPNKRGHSSKLCDNRSTDPTMSVIQ